MNLDKTGRRQRQAGLHPCSCCKFRRNTHPACTSCSFPPQGGIFDLIGTRRSRGAICVGIPDRIAGAERNVIRARSTHNRLVEVIAHRLRVGNLLEIRHISLLNVVETHRDRPFLTGLIGKCEGCGLPFEPAQS